MRRRGPIHAATLAALALFGMGANAVAAPGNWDHEANVKDAATRLVILHRRQGSDAVMKFLDACYRTHSLASEFTQGLEACMAQDYMHTRALTLIYSRLPAERMQNVGAPTAQGIAAALNARFVNYFTQYKVTVADADDFKKIVERVGVPIFFQGVFPKSQAPAAPSPNLPEGR